MEEIFDQEIQSQKNERTINRVTALARCIYIILVSYLIISILVNDMEGTIRNVLSHKVKFIVGVFITLPFFYYNIRHANIEWKSNYVYPIFRRPVIIVFIFYSCYLLFIFAKSTIDSFIYFYSFPDEHSYLLMEFMVRSIISVTALAWIVYREFVYLRRVSKS